MLRHSIDHALWLLQVTLRALLSPTVMGANGAIFDDRGRVLLVRHGYRAGWYLPGGAVERGEPPADAVLRELSEEVGLVGGTLELVGLYTRRAGWVSNVVAFYRITGGTVNFQPGWEIREIQWVDPAAPPRECSRGTLRRLAELRGAEISPYW